MAQPKTITRADLVEALFKNAKTPRGLATSFLESMLSLMVDALVQGQTVKLARFGNFQVRAKTARLGRNPKTGEEVPITPRRVVTFKPSPMMRARLEKPEGRSGKGAAKTGRPAKAAKSAKAATPKKAGAGKAAKSARSPRPKKRGG